MKMKLALIGATGTIGQRILSEALSRGHEVTVIARDPSRLTEPQDRLNVVQGDIMDAGSIAKAAAGHDLVISAYGPPFTEVQLLLQATKALLQGVKQAGVSRLISVGGAGSLEVAPGLQVVDTPEFPDFIKPLALAHRDAQELYTEVTDLNWTVFSPAGTIEPGERTGQFRTGTNSLVVNEQGESRISAEDYAVALLDEAEKSQYPRQRFTVGY